MATKSNNRSSGRKGSGRSLNAKGEASTHPQYQVSRRTEVNRAGPGFKGGNNARGDRRDTGKQSY